MTTTEQLERALVAIRDKGDKFGPLMPDRIDFEYDAVMAAKNVADLEHNRKLIQRLTGELVARGYTVHSFMDNNHFCEKFVAIKNTP